MEWVLKAGFTQKHALGRVGELLKMAPEKLADEIGFPKNVHQVQEGMDPKPFDGLTERVQRVNLQMQLDQQIEDLKEGRSWRRFLGQGAVEGKLAKLEQQRKALGDRLDLVSWFYRHPRIWLLGAVRDAVMEVSRHAEIEWVEMETGAGFTPTSAMLLSGNPELAQEFETALSSPFASLSPEFILQKCDGHRTLVFDFEKGQVFFFTPVKDSETASEEAEA